MIDIEAMVANFRAFLEDAVKNGYGVSIIQGQTPIPIGPSKHHITVGDYTGPEMLFRGGLPNYMYVVVAETEREADRIVHRIPNPSKLPGDDEPDECDLLLARDVAALSERAKAAGIIPKDKV